MSDKLDEKALYAAAEAQLNAHRAERGLPPTRLDQMRPEHRPEWFAESRAAITAYLAACPGSTGAAEGWRDIASAPKDGTWILGASDNVEDWFLVVSWEEPSAQEPWSWRTQDGFLYHATALTHWRPLPAPPSALSAAGESEG